MEELLKADNFYEKLTVINQQTNKLFSEYKRTYTEIHNRRTAAFSEALKEIKSYPEWSLVSEEMQGTILAPLYLRACQDLELNKGAKLTTPTICPYCKATIGQMEADLVGLPGFKTQIMARIQELTVPQKIVQRVQIAKFFPSTLEREESIDEAIERLREHLHKLVAEGVTIILE